MDGKRWSEKCWASRKNRLFSDTPAGAKASAVIYSIVETAKANSLAPRDYIQLSAF